MNSSIILQNIDTESLKSIIREVNAEMIESFQPKQLPKEQYLTRKEVAKALRVSLPTLNELTKKGKLTGYRLNGRVLYKFSEVDSSLIQIVASKYRR